jgi:hypothetical protein
VVEPKEGLVPISELAQVDADRDFQQICGELIRKYEIQSSTSTCTSSPRTEGSARIGSVFVDREHKF